MFKLFRTFLIVLLLSTPLKAICQIDVPKWVDDIGGSNSSCISSGIEVDNQNNVYVSGIFSGTADMDPSGAVYNLTAKGEFDLFLAKYTTNGALIWAIDAGGSAYVQVNAMAIDQNGNCIVTGQFNSSFDADSGPGNTTLTPVGDYDAFIIKYNTNGKFVWARSIGGTGTDYGSHIATDSQGNIFECVRFQSTVTVGGKTVTAGGGDFNGLTVKYDPNGNVLWKINISDPGNSEVFDEVDPQGNVIVGGHFQSNDNFNPLGAAHMLNANGDAQFIAKYTTAGQLIWVQKFGGVLAGNNLNLGIDNEGNVIADGPFSSQLNFNGGTTVLNPTGSQDLFLAKYTTDGVFQSAKDIGGAGSSIFNYTIHASHDDNIFITGYFSGKIDFDPSPATTSLISDHGQRDFFLAKYDNDLNYKWAFSGGSPNCDQSLGRNTCIDNNNDVLFTGAFCSTVNFSASTCTPYVLTAQSVGASPARDCFVGKYVQSEATVASQITAFSVPQEIAPAVIDQTKLSITVTVPPGTNITALVPTITYTTGVTLTPASGKAEDFTSGVTYKLTTSCTSLNYSVNVVFAISSPVTICSGTTASLTGDTETPVPDSYLWQVSQNGTWVSAAGTINGQNYQTPVLNNATASNVIYSYRRQTTTAGVIAYDSYFDVTVLPAIAGNTITAPTVISFCSNGDPSTISGSTPTGGNGTYTYQWQSSADGISFNNIAGAASKDYDPPVLTTTTYYQRIVNSCGPQVISNVVKITIVPPPVPPAPFSQSICTGATATLTIADAQSGVTYNWYDSAAKTNLLFTGTTYVTGPLNVNTTYYVEAANGTCVSTTTAIVQVNVITPPAAPTVISPVVACDGTTVSLSVSNPQPGLTYNWYTVPTGGTSVATGSTYAVTASASNITYYVEAVNTNSCTGPRSEIDITVVPIPAAPVVTVPAICAGSATVLTISNPQAGLTYNWYATATDQTPLASGTQFNTPTLLNNTTYYVEAVSNTGGCTSTRVAVLVTITPLAVAPGNLTQSVCAGSPVTLTLSDAQTGITYNWYDSPAKTNLLFTGTTYTVNAVNSNTTYYVEAVNGSCPALSLATVQVNVIALPSAPAVVKSVLQTCANTQVTLSIYSPQPGFTYNWYTASTGGTAAGTGTDFVTPVLTTGSTYYAEAVNANGCVSSRTPVNVNVSPLPDVSTQGASVCPGTNATLTASSTDANATINWYARATGGLPIGTGNSFTTPNLNDITTYYAQAVDGVSGCASATRSAATVNIYQQLAAPVVTVDGSTSSSVTFKWDAVSGASGYLVSIDNGVTYTAPSSGSDGLSTTITGLQQDQTVTILVEATGVSTCQLSGSSTAVTGVAHDSKNDIIYVANTFTPNGDGKNDVVYVHSNNIKSMVFYVYDQWGEMLFKSTNINVGWDGTYKGTKQPVGVYVYFVQAVMNDGTQLTKKGTITLIR